MGVIGLSTIRLITCLLAARLANAESLKVLFVGNSYTYFNGGLDQVPNQKNRHIASMASSTSECVAGSWLAAFRLFSLQCMCHSSCIACPVASPSAMRVVVQGLSSRQTHNATLFGAWEDVS